MAQTSQFRWANFLTLIPLGWSHLFSHNFRLTICSYEPSLSIFTINIIVESMWSLIYKSEYSSNFKFYYKVNCNVHFCIDKYWYIVHVLTRKICALCYRLLEDIFPEYLLVNYYCHLIKLSCVCNIYLNFNCAPANIFQYIWKHSTAKLYHAAFWIMPLLYV